MQILFVLRDIMPARMAVPIICRLQQGGHGVVAIAEGKAVGECRRSGIEPILTGGDKLKQFGPPGAVRRLLPALLPDTVCIGCSYPINWELEFAQTAREKKIPVVALEDIWGALTRLEGFNPDLALVMDDLAAASCPRVKTAVIGDVAITTDVSVADDQKAVLRRLEEIYTNHQTVLVIGEGLDAVAELVALVGSSIKLETQPADFVVIPRLIHPKLAKQPEAVTAVEQANRLLRDLLVERFEGLSVDALIARCHYTVTGFGTTLRIAAYYGRRGISVMTPRMRAGMVAETGFQKSPLVTAGVTPELVEPRPFSSLPWTEFSRRAREWAKTARFRPEVGAEAIISLTAEN